MSGTILHTLIWNNSIEQWMLALAWAGWAWVVGKLLYWASSTVLRRLAARTETRLDDILITALRGPIVVLVTVIGLYLAYHQLDIPERMDRWADRVFKVASVLTLTWVVARMLEALVEEYLVPKARREETTVIKSQLVPVVRSATKALVWAMGIVLALNNAGYNVGALLAGIGIGGLAMAMAAKDTVANIFGGITVFADKPFQTGDRVRVAGYDGVVQEVGIRSTRIRTLDGPIVVVPNFKFTDSVLENVTNEPARRIRHELGLVYETPPEKIEEALALLNKLVDDHQDVLEQERVVSFHAFKDYSLSILFAYHIRKSADIMHTQSLVHLELLRRFHAAGLEFAYPTAVEIPGELKR
jgi:MscS family membrane protein